MRVAVVVNAAAGTARGEGDLHGRLELRLAAAGHAVVAAGDAVGDVAQSVKAAVAGGAEVVLVGGGDGTVNCAAQVLAGTPAALAIVPLGTMNKLARDLAIPLEPGAAAALVDAGVPRRIDVGEVNGRVFLRSSFLGFPAHLAQRREQLRGRLGWRGRWLLAVAFARALGRYPALPVTLRLAANRPPRRRVRARMLAVAVGPYAEGFGRVLDKARADAGELVLYRARGLGVWRFLRLAVGMLAGSWRGMPELEEIRARRLVVASPKRRLRVMNDGEPLLLVPPLRYRVRPKALTVLVPRPDAGTAETAGAAP
jgi:diacylglycerol kinase family enzyme